jgi:ferric-dicitrate binding protein FerR (iron transport regulator)
MNPYDTGHSAFYDGEMEDNNPHAPDSEDALDWRDGWLDAQDEKK